MSQTIQFVDAQRSESRLRLAIMGPAGGGKTFTLLDMMFGIVKDWSKVFVIDTERGSAALYDNKCAGGPKFKVFRMEPPYSPERYRQAIKAAEAAGAEAIIVDSLSHAWEGEGGALDKVDAASGRSGNSYTAWKDVTPEHRAMVDTILQSPCHIGVALRSKTEYVLEPNEKGKMVPRRVGLAPIQRAGMEYEFTVFMDIDDSHHALASKDRTGLFDQRRFKPGVETGVALKKWLDLSPTAPAPAPVKVALAQDQRAVEDVASAAAAKRTYPVAAVASAVEAPDFSPGSLVAAVELHRKLSARILEAKTRKEGAALWDEVTKARSVLGDESVNEMLGQLKTKASTLSVE